MLCDSRAILFLVAGMMLTACGSSSSSTVRGSTVASTSSSGADSGTTTATPTVGTFGGAAAVKGSVNTVVAQPSISGPMSVTVDSTQTLSIAFTSSDGLPISGFGINASLGGLPAGWSGPSTFTCASASIGSGCVLNLTYRPTAAASGSLKIDYVYIDNAGFSRTGDTIVVPYTSTVANNVFANAVPTGQVNSVINKGPASVIINFAADDQNAATALTLSTDLTALPAGWSSAVANFSCAIVSSGNGCQLMLRYTPTAVARGSLHLTYTYVDDAGDTKSGVINVPYASAATGTVVATAAPNGQVNAIQTTGGQAVAVTFNTTDGKPASDMFLLTDLSKLSSGWSAATASFGCSGISTGNGCELHLNYAPKSLSGGTLVLTYGYTDAGGMAQRGTLDLPYIATTNDNAVATPSPSGQINAVVGMGSQVVTVTFSTDDIRLATALTLTDGLTAMPDGWSTSNTAFACAAFGNGAVCQLGLLYAPTLSGNGTLMLKYSYRNNANVAKVGSVAIAYRATTDNNVAGTASSTALTVRSGSTNAVSISFATDDGNPASALQLTSNLALLPAGWNAGSSGFACATVSAGVPCVLPLTYAPTVADSGALTLSFTYLNNSGFAKTNNVTIAYTAITPYLYVTNSLASTVSVCPINADDTLLSCRTSGSSFSQPVGFSIAGNRAFITNQSGNFVTRCDLGAGSLSNCLADPTTFTAPTFSASNSAGNRLYIGQNAGVTLCPIASSGLLYNCIAASTAIDPANGVAISSDGTHAYSVHASALEVCDITVTGTLSSCSVTGATSGPVNAVLAINNGVLYATSQAGALLSCAINGDATVGFCQTSMAGTSPQSIAFSGNTAYLSSGGTAVLQCPLATDGSTMNCTPYTDLSFSGTGGLAVR